MSEKLDLTPHQGKQSSYDLVYEMFNINLNAGEEKIKKQFKKVYQEQYKDMDFTLEQRMLMLSSFGQYKEGFSWFAGDIILFFEKKIYAGEIEGIKSLSQFFDMNEQIIGMSRTSFFDSKNVRERFPDFDEYLDIGIAKARHLLSIGEDETFTKIAKEVAKKNFTVDKVKEMVDEYKFQKQSEKEEFKNKENKKAQKKYTYDITEKGDSIVLTAKNFDKMLLHRALNKYEQAIKNYIRSEADKNPQET